MENTLPEGWEWKKLGDLIELKYGKGLKKENRDTSGKFPVYGSNGIVDYHDEAIVFEPCLIVGRKGSIGAVHLSKSPCWAIDTTYYILPPKEVDLTFLFYLLPTLKLENLNKSTAIPGLNREDVYSKLVPVPPLETQKKIVSILEKAEETKKLRAQADELTQKFLQSVFLEMFGYPLEDQKDLRAVPLETVCSEIYRYPTFYGFEYIEMGVPIVRIGNILGDGSLDANKSNYVFIDPELNKKFPRTILELNDIVMAVRGDGSTAKRIGLVNNPNIAGANISPNLIRIKANKDIINPVYLFHFLTSAYGQLILQRSITRTAKKTITAENIKQIALPYPSIENQTKFAEIVGQVEKTKQTQQQSSVEINMLFNALMQKAFTGELVL